MKIKVNTPSGKRVQKPNPNRIEVNIAPLCLALSALVASGPVVAAPTGGVVTSGNAVINQSGTVTNVNQSSRSATINWQGFSVLANETVNFNQPSVAAITLNRVIGNERSVIDGAINAIGKVFLLNSNGVLIGKTAAINTGSFLATTLNISDEDFNAGNYVFRRSGSRGSIINMGTINAAEGGYVALLGDSVSNQGVISATKGTVVLAGGNRITLNFNGDSLLGVTIDEGALNALVENRQAIYADGGRVILTARAADELLGSQVNNTGLIRARTLDDLTGNIELYAHGGTTNIDGTLDASAPTSGNGGFVETSGDHVKIADTAQILTHSAHGANGSWLIDPVDFTIAASGGDMTGTFLSNYLNNQGSFTVQSANGSLGSNGDINVNDAITWSSNNSLTLTAAHDININNAITLNGASAGLVMNYGNDYKIRTKASYSGAVLDTNGKLVAQTDTSGGVYGSITFTNSANTHGLTINGNNYTLIYSMSQLDGLDGYNAATSTGTATALTGYYALAGNLDASGTTYTSSLLGNSDSAAFTGTLTGLGHTISSLAISAPTTGVSYLGLIGYASGATLRDIGLVNVNINSQSYSGAGTGALVGHLDGGTVYNAYSTGTVTGLHFAGGLMGLMAGGTLSYAYSDVDGATGGLAATVNGVTASHVHATGDTNGGGLFGGMVDGSLSYAYATGTVTGDSAGGEYGGLIGSVMLDVTSSPSTLYPVSFAFATGDVSGGYDVGGLIGKVCCGKSSNSYVIDHVHATGNVTATATEDIQMGNALGGLIGYIGIQGSLTISGAYATGDVRAVDGYGGESAYAGGLIGSFSTTRYATITNSYATGDVYSPTGFAVGGLVGSMSGNRSSTISGSYATGNVMGGENVGGLVGTQGKGSITSSYATGETTSANGGYAGGLIGDAGTTTIGSDVYYNGDGNASSIGYVRSTNVDHSTGLSRAQLGDIAYYLNGTINQVLAARAAAAAAKEALESRASDSTSKSSNLVASASRQNVVNLPSTSSLASTPPSLANHITLSDLSFSADIKSITVDGVRFDLDDNAPRGDSGNTRR